MNLNNKRCKMFYTDGRDVQVRIGIVSSEDETFFVLENAVLIPKDRIIRVEVISQ